MTRGISNHNPGNLEKNKDKWQGLREKQTDRRFFQFTDAVYGIRALARTLITYQDKYGLNTVDKIIKRWAPPSENNTQAYANNVARYMGVGTTFKINVHNYATLRPMVYAIIRQENGSVPYTDAQLDKGLALAGVEPPKQTLAKSGTVKAATAGVSVSTITGGAAVLTTAAPAVGALGDIAETVREYGVTLAIMAAVVGIGLFGYIVYRRWDDARRLAR